MKMSQLIKMLTAVMFLLSFSGLIYAGTEVKDVIEMKDPGYAKHKKAIVKFTHKKHHEEYKVACGECHHDKDHKPLNNLKAGDDVKQCSECHKQFKKIKGKSLSKAKKLQYQAKALHDNCKGCHKKFNKKTKSKKAPTSCKKCHKK